MKEERWMPIEGYENYLVSNTGRIKGSKGNLLTIVLDKYGYETVSLCKHSKPKTFLVHRIVAKAFIPNPKNLQTVDHIDGNKRNNNEENLQWLSRRENLQKYHREQGHKIYNEKRYGGRKKGETRRIKVNQFTRNGELVNTYISFMDAERKTGIRSGNISMCVNGYKTSAGGYVWRKAQ